MTVQTAPLRPLSWLGIVRLGLVQTALGAIFVLVTSTLNRVMVIEYALPAALPGALIGLHYATQVLRPVLGHGSDRGGRRTPWIIGGMGLLALGGVLAAVATVLMRAHLIMGLGLAVVAFLVIGVGVGAAGTTLLVLIAKRTAPARRPAAATVAYVMMICGFILTAAIARATLDPFSPERLVAVAAGVSGGGFLIACLAVWGIEGRDEVVAAPIGLASDRPFGPALRQVWADPVARRFAIFVFVSMLAYGGEELLIEPFAGAIFGMTPGRTAALSGALHGGSLVGMVLVGAFGTALRRWRVGSLEAWMTGGCVASAAALATLGSLGIAGAARPLPAVIFILGVANGGYAIAAIASMMQKVGAGGGEAAGVRMGLWGAAQALAFGSGGLAATLLSDLARSLFAGPPRAYALVFGAEALIFLIAAGIAARLDPAPRRDAERMGLPVEVDPMIATALDFILVMVMLEGVALALYYRRFGRGIAPRRLVPNLAAGFFLMLAVRLALAGAAEGPLALCLLAALAAHLVDLAARWRSA